jgi:hypothetical protein
MQSRDQIFQLYLDAADSADGRRDPGLREGFLMLAADTALKAGRADEAERLRQELLNSNPYHALKPFPSFVEAARHPDIKGYLDDLRLKYPPEVVEEMLETIWPTTPGEPPADMPATLDPRGPVPSQGKPVSPPVTRNAEPLRVFRETSEVEETQPPPRLPDPVRNRPAPPKPAAPVPQRQEKPAPRPAPKPALPQKPRPVVRATFPPRPTAPVAPQPTEHHPAENDLAGGAWVGAVLFLVVLLAGTALAAWTLLPPDLARALLQR